MIDRYLKFSIPNDIDLVSFSDVVAIDAKNRIRLPREIKKVFSQSIFDILAFHDKEIPYIQLVPSDFYTKSYRCFLEHWQRWIFDNNDISAWIASFEEYSARANTISLDGEDRLIIPSLVIKKFSLQSAQKIHMVMSYPYIKIYDVKDYNSLLAQYANTDQ